MKATIEDNIEYHLVFPGEFYGIPIKAISVPLVGDILYVQNNMSVPISSKKYIVDSVVRDVLVFYEEHRNEESCINVKVSEYNE